MKYLICLLISSTAFATDLIGIGSVLAPNNLVIQADEGVNVSAGSSILISAGGDGVMTLSTGNTSDITLSPGGAIVLIPGSGYQSYVFGESAQVMTAHGLQLTAFDTAPTCDSSRRGTLYYSAGATSVADQLQVCMRDSSDVYSWKNVSF